LTLSRNSVGWASISAAVILLSNSSAVPPAVIATGRVLKAIAQTAPTSSFLPVPAPEYSGARTSSPCASQRQGRQTAVSSAQRNAL
jgi:hypothetical protein